VSSGNLSEPYNRQIGVALFTAVVAALASAVTAAQMDWRRCSPHKRDVGTLGDADGLAQ
jgi:hypothetical protein